MRTICGIILAAAVALTVVGRIDAATKTWSGAVNNYDWTDAGNYQGGLPSSGDTVALPDGASVQLNAAAIRTIRFSAGRSSPPRECRWANTGSRSWHSVGMTRHPCQAIAHNARKFLR